MKAKLSHTQIIALGFFLMIALGTVLLRLPVASADGEGARFGTAFFTATSATCVTGLVVRDTALGWSYFGQTVILVLIQIGGLGFMTVATLFFMLLRRRVGLRQREVMVESLNSTQVGGILRLTKLILLGTLFFEGVGAAVLSIRFVPLFGVGRGIFVSVFHAVSAFCNAGFDLMGSKFGAYASFTAFTEDILVNVTLCVLIVVGGLGFIVWEDVWRKGLRWRRYRLQTKLVLSASAILILGGALLLWLTEYGMKSTAPAAEQILASLFGSVTARTAGFNTTDTAALTPAGRLLTILLMLVGGSPGSTAGGVKTTTMAVLLFYSISGIRHDQSPNVFGRRIGAQELQKAVAVFAFNLALALVGAFTLCALQPLTLSDALFEAFSAIGTVGMSTGITRELCTAARGVIILMMYLGRVGSVSFAVALMESRAAPDVTYPTEKITIG